MSAALQVYRAWLGLGGNMGDPVASMAKALQLLDARADTEVAAVSPVYRTPPWGKTDQDWFHNACAEVLTTLEPVQLIETCLDVERALKRVRLERWGPRIIDIDILAMEDLTGREDRAGRAVTMSGPALQLPHPRMHERAFVLAPLNDIAPALSVAGRTVAAWLGTVDHADMQKTRTDASWWRE